jgi:tRNA U34 5-carboxymethylaminomethyl modifying GTPase MnmE/TrmE
VAFVVRELTPAGAGAVSVLEVTGSGAIDAVRSLTGDSTLHPGELRLLRLSEDDEDLDEALCVVVDAERVELHLHGNPIVTARVTRALGGEARPLEERELKQEAWTLLARARGEVAARVLLDQAQGALTRRIEELAELDERGARAGLEELVERSIAFAPALNPPRVVLAGPVNSGKSTLFNALVGSDRAITSDEPGTTRDVVFGGASLGGVEYELIDTAGVRAVDGDDGDEAVEREGQLAACALREGAHVVFWLERADGPHAEIPAGCELLLSHADQATDPPPGSISALNDPAGAREEIARRLAGSAPSWVPNEPVLFNARLLAWGVELLSGSSSALCVRLRERSMGVAAQ